jgi:uncharacterized oxidoreductase
MRFPVASATQLASDLICALGAPQATAARIAASLVLADQRDTPTHGLALLPLYAELIDEGLIDPASTPDATSLGGAITRVDGRRAFGQLTAALAVDHCLRALPQHGVAAAGIVDGTHLGRLGEWAELACEQDAVFLAFTNTGGGARNVAGPHSAGRVLSTNPIAVGIPACGALDHPVIVDFAASQTSGSRIREVANAGGRLDPDWLVRDDGQATDDPAAFLEGLAALRPLGGRSAGHKGFGLMVAGELLAALAGNLMAGERRESGFTNGALFCVLDISRFGEREAWAERVAAFRDYLTANDCRLPGAGKAAGDGDTLTLPDHVTGGIAALAERLGVDRRGLEPTASGAGVTRTW